jgi:hypothetical protein
MVVDAELAVCIAQGAVTDAQQRLLQGYREVAANTPNSARAFDSVIKQLRFQAAMLKARDDAAQAASLEGLAKALAPLAGVPAPATS